MSLSPPPPTVTTSSPVNTQYHTTGKRIKFSSSVYSIRGNKNFREIGYVHTLSFCELLYINLQNYMLKQGIMFNESHEIFHGCFLLFLVDFKDIITIA